MSPADMAAAAAADRSLGGAVGKKKKETQKRYTCGYGGGTCGSCGRPLPRGCCGHRQLVGVSSSLGVGLRV